MIHGSIVLWWFPAISAASSHGFFLCYNSWAKVAKAKIPKDKATLELTQHVPKLFATQQHNKTLQVRESPRFFHTLGLLHHMHWIGCVFSHKNPGENGFWVDSCKSWSYKHLRFTWRKGCFFVSIIFNSGEKPTEASAGNKPGRKPSMWTQESSFWRYRVVSDFDMGVEPKIGVEKTQMDGENYGKPYFLMDDLGGKPTIFGNTHIQTNLDDSFSAQLVAPLSLSQALDAQTNAAIWHRHLLYRSISACGLYWIEYQNNIQAQHPTNGRWCNKSPTITNPQISELRSISSERDRWTRHLSGSWDNQLRIVSCYKDFCCFYRKTLQIWGFNHTLQKKSKTRLQERWSMRSTCFRV